MLSSSRDSWERLVAAVLKRQQIWELCHQQSRTPSICSTISSDDLSVQTSRNSASFSVHPLPQLPPEVPSVSQADYPKVYQGQLERFSLHQLLVATDKFSRKKLLGKVYKGRLIDGTLVAIKGLWTTDGELQFQTKVQMFSIMAVAEHSNVLRLRGFCMNSREQFLVYPYMVNGSLASYLRGRQLVPLDWGTRKRIALGIARGLCYLHDHKIIHCNVKASNILLDEEYEAVVGDFSSAKLMDHNDTQVTAVVRGDIGCITPEYLSTGKTSEKTDVYGYGATLLELITGQTTRALARLASDDDLMLFDWVKEHLKEKKLDLSKKEKKEKKKKEKKLEMLVDPALRKNYVDEEVEFLIQVSLLCTQSSPLGRPKMSEVVMLLEGNRLRMGTTSWLWGSFFKKFK